MKSDPWRQKNYFVENMRMTGVMISKDGVNYQELLEDLENT